MRIHEGEIVEFPVVANGVRVGVSQKEGPVEADDGDVEVETQAKTGIHGELVVENSL